MTKLGCMHARNMPGLICHTLFAPAPTTMWISKVWLQVVHILGTRRLKTTIVMLVVLQRARLVLQTRSAALEPSGANRQNNSQFWRTTCSQPWTLPAAHGQSRTRQICTINEAYSLDRCTNTSIRGNLQSCEGRFASMSPPDVTEGESEHQAAWYQTFSSPREDTRS